MPSRSFRLALLAMITVAAHGCVLITGDFNPLARHPQPLEERVISGRGKAKILMIDVTGVIGSEPREGALGLSRQESTLARIQAELDQADEDEQIKAVVLRVNSPGGTVTASDIIYDRLMRFRAKHGTPVLVQMLDVAASGGYYISLAADEIVASPTTVTGSIGVIFTSVSLAGLMEKIGVRDQTIVSGNMKDIGSPLRTMTPAEREVLQKLIGDMQSRFVGLVRERRTHLTPEMNAQLVDGRVFSAEQAHAGGLVDTVGYLDGTIERAKQRAGVSEATVVRYFRDDEYADSIYARAPGGAAPQVNQINLLSLSNDGLSPGPHFLYLWAP